MFQGPDTVAAFIAEPVQGAGGVIVPPANYWPLVRKICDKHGVLLIADEVVTGFGRTGHLFGTRLWGVNADLWCLAKGISSGYVPLGATAISGEGGPGVRRRQDRPGRGEPRLHLQCPPGGRRRRAGHAGRDSSALDVPGNAGRVGAVMQERLRKLEKTCSFVGNVRGIGLMLGIEMVEDKALRTPMPRSSDIPARVAKEAYQRGLMVRISGPNLILSPPLVITLEEIGFLCDHAGGVVRGGGGFTVSPTKAGRAPVILLIGTVDTKSDEIAYLRESGRRCAAAARFGDGCGRARQGRLHARHPQQRSCGGRGRDAPTGDGHRRREHLDEADGRPARR